MGKQPKDDGGIDLQGKETTADVAMERVISLRTKVQELQRENRALQRDREQLLIEYKDMRDARPVKTSPVRLRATDRQDRVRVSFGDLHGMRMDREAFCAMVRDLKTLDPDEIVIGGDLGEVGGWLAKYQAVGYVAEADYSYQEDMGACNWALDEIQTAAPHAEIHYLLGNHEDRVEKWIIDQTQAHQRDAKFLLDAFGPVAMMRLEERGIRWYSRDKTYARHCPPGWIKRGKMFFVHELGSGANAARGALLKTAGNVTFFHTHREDTATINFPGVGLVKAFCPGCLCVRQPMWQHSNPTNWSHGYAVDVIAKSGRFQRFHVPIWEGESFAGMMVERFKS